MVSEASECMSADHDHCSLAYFQIKPDNRCMYNSIRRRFKTPMEYTGTHLKRQIIHFMALRADVFSKYTNDHILFEYNNPDLNHGFSYKDYLLYMHQDHSWGDACILYAASLLFECSISVLFPKTLKHLSLRHHENDLSKVDVVLLNSGGQHYSAIGKGRRRIQTGRRRIFQVAPV